jgi:hypothetical protein
MSGQPHFELDAPVQLFTLAATALLRAPAGTRTQAPP